MSPILVFDLDGTLVDSAGDLLATLDAVLPLHGIPPCGDARLKDGIGHGARHLIENALRRHGVRLDEAAVSAIHRDFLVYYERNIAVHTRPYRGVVALLDRFEAAGWTFAVCSNKFEALSRRLLGELGLLSRFAAIGGGDSFANRKPHPGHLLQTVAAAGGKPAHAIMVGDSRTDLATARAARVPFVGVSFGYTPVPMAELAPDLLIDAYDDFSVERAERLIAEGVRADIPPAVKMVGATGIEPVTPPV